MTRLEDAIRESLRQHDVARPPLPSASELVGRAGRRVRLSRAVTVITAAATAVTIAVAGSAVATRPHHKSAPAQPGPSPNVFVATDSRGLDEKTGLTTTKLEERALSDGHLTRQIATITSEFQQFALAPDGSILAAVSDQPGCTDNIERINRTTGARQLVRTIKQSVHSVSVSPDSNRIAFITYPQCVSGAKTSSDPQPAPTFKPAYGQASAPAAFPPNVLVVLDLASGHYDFTASETPGHPLYGASWSPDGRTLAVGYFNNGYDAVLLMPAARPDFRTAARVVPPPHCVYSAAAWTTVGLVVSKACGRNSLGMLNDDGWVVQLDKLGRETRSWKLPACASAGAFPDKLFTRLIVGMTIGHGAEGEDPCASERPNGLSRYALVEGDHLRTIANQEPYVGFGLLGW